MAVEAALQFHVALLERLQVHAALGALHVVQLLEVLALLGRGLLGLLQGQLALGFCRKLVFRIDLDGLRPRLLCTGAIPEPFSGFSQSNPRFDEVRIPFGRFFEPAGCG